MRSMLLFTIVCWMLRSSGLAAQPADPVLLSGLSAWYANGAAAALIQWYAHRPELAEELNSKLQPVIQGLGPVVDSEVIAIQTISARVTRYYIAIHFTETPLWLRIERYANGPTAIFLPLRFSTDADRILPGYLTE